MNIQILKLFILLFGLSIGHSFALEVEVSQSIPVETTLKVPGIRETQEVWVELISSAQKTIDIEQFYINNQSGQSLDPVMSALLLAATRGVQIRLIVDRKFFQNYPEVPNQFSQLKNMQVKIVDFSKMGGVQHAKFFIVDGMNSFIGSANFDWLALSHIHEVGLRVSDMVIANGLESIFNQDWAIAASLGGSASSFVRELDSVPSKTGTSVIRMIASPAAALPVGVAPSIDGMISLIAAAKTALKIQVYQYSTKGNWTILDQELRKAATRGVQVKLMVDAVALKNSTTELTALAQVKNIQVKVVTIPKWSGGEIPYSRLVHSKYFTVDGNYAWVGTENWSEGYFTSCRNVGIILQNTVVAGQLDQIYDRLWTSTYSRAL
jgi:phosphatidylserine/phosphatidylglycerophosphate/cardiolipin synthase-like enzyme